MRGSAAETTFTYPSIYKTMALVGALIIIGALIWFAAKLSPLILWPDQSRGSILLICGMLVFYFGAFALVLTTMLNSAQDFTLSENGLRLQVFHIWWINLSWDDVVDLKQSWLYPGFSILVVRKLTPLHYWIGLIYAFTFRPAFMIHVSLGLDEFRKAQGLIRKYAPALR